MRWIIRRTYEEFGRRAHVHNWETGETYDIPATPSVWGRRHWDYFRPERLDEVIDELVEMYGVLIHSGAAVESAAPSAMVTDMPRPPTDDLTGSRTAPRLNIRRSPEEQALWGAAAKLLGKYESDWAREVLSEAAREVLRAKSQGSENRRRTSK